MAVAQYELTRMQAAEHWWQRTIEIGSPIRGGIPLAGVHRHGSRGLRGSDESLPDKRWPSIRRMATPAWGCLRRWLRKAISPVRCSGWKKPICRWSPPRRRLSCCVGQIHLELQQYRQAQEWFEKAARFMPRAPQPYYGLANASARLGEREKAAEYRRKFPGIDAGLMRRSWTNRKVLPETERMSARRQPGSCLWSARPPPGWATCRRPSGTGGTPPRSIRPTAPRGRCWLTITRVGDNCRKLVALLAQLVTAAPEDMRFRLMLASAYIRLGRGEPAETALREAHRLDPDQPAVSTVLAQYLVRENRNLDEAVQLGPAGGRTGSHRRQLLCTECGLGGRRAATTGDRRDRTGIAAGTRGPPLAGAL